MKEIRVWFGDNFKSLERVIPGLAESSKKYGDRFGSAWVLCTNREDRPALRASAHHFEVEPDSSDFEGYKKWALELIQTHRIAFVVPGRRREILAKMKDEIEALPGNPKVLAAAPLATLRGLDDKQWTFENCHSRGVGDLAPTWKMAKNPEEMEKALAFVKSTGARRLCMKPAKGIYGKGFRFIRHSDAEAPGKKITDTPPHGISIKQALALSAATEEHPRMLCMPMLRGPELSIDCFAQGGKMVAQFTRVKRGRTQRAETSEEAKACCERLAEAFGFDGFFNAQLRYEAETGKLKLLEINPRMAGGTSYGQKAGFDLVYWCLSAMSGFCVQEDFPAIEEGMIISVKGSRIAKPAVAVGESQ